MSKSDHEHTVVRHMVSAPPGWQAINAKTPAERKQYPGEKGATVSIHDDAWVEQIPAFVLVERWYCHDEHNFNTDAPPDGWVPLESPGPPFSWFEFVPILRLESYHFGFPHDQYTDADIPDLVLAPDENPESPWVRERVVGGK